MASHTDAAGGELAPSDIWEIVSLLSEKLKKTRDELEAVRADNEQLRSVGGMESYTPSDEVRQLQDALRNSEAERHQQDVHIAELRRQISDLQAEAKPVSEASEVEAELMAKDVFAYRPLSPSGSATVVSDDGQPAQGTELQMTGMPKPYLAQVDPSNFARPTMPDWSSLEPCFRIGPKFKLTVPQDVMVESQCAEPLFCRQHLVWHSPATRDHAYLIRPQAFYNVLQEGDKWTRNTESDIVLGQTREVFYHAPGPGSAIRYAGTYHWSEVVELLPSEHRHLPPQLFKKLRQETVMDGHLLSSKIKCDASNDVSCHYRSGTAKLVCVVMQCVGFNQALYDGLVRGREIDKKLARAHKVVEKLSNKRKMEISSKPAKKVKS